MVDALLRVKPRYPVGAVVVWLQRGKGYGCVSLSWPRRPVTAAGRQPTEPWSPVRDDQATVLRSLRPG